MLTKEQKEQAIDILKSVLPRYITNPDGASFNKFINDKLTLEQLGICNGVAKFIDVKLQKVHPDICILAHDTFSKFKKDLNIVDKVFQPTMDNSKRKPKRKKTKTETY